MKRQKRKLNPSVFLILFLLLILILIIKATVFSGVEYFSIKEKVDIQQEDFAKGTVKKETLEERIEIVKSEKFYQQQLLDKYMLVRPGERVINLVD